MDIMRKENTFPPPSGRRDLLSSPGVDPALRSPKRLAQARGMIVKRRSGNNLSRPITVEIRGTRSDDRLVRLGLCRSEFGVCGAEIRVFDSENASFIGDFGAENGFSFIRRRKQLFCLVGEGCLAGEQAVLRGDLQAWDRNNR